MSILTGRYIYDKGTEAILTCDPEHAYRAKHLCTTAKLPHSWEYKHDKVGFNYRMPNLNADKSGLKWSRFIVSPIIESARLRERTSKHRRVAKLRSFDSLFRKLNDGLKKGDLMMCGNQYLHE